MGAECAAGVAGIVGALGEVAASGTLAMTSCKEFPLAGVAAGDGVDNAPAHRAACHGPGGVGSQRENAAADCRFPCRLLQCWWFRCQNGHQWQSYSSYVTGLERMI